MEQENILGKEKIGKLILKFSIPCIVSMLVNSLYNIVDQIFIGQGVGPLGNGATNVVFPLVMIGLAFSLMFGDGASAYLSLKLGEKKKKEAEIGIGNGILLSAIVSIFFCIITLIFLPQFLTIFGCTEKLREFAMIYGKIIAIGLPFSMIGTTLNSIIRADGNPKFAMMSMVAGAILNTILDPIFIFKFDMGVAGAAIATVISQVLTFVLNVAYIKKFKSIQLSKESFKLKAGVCKKVSMLGISSFITQMSIVCVMTAENNLLGKYGADSKYGAEIPITVLGIVMKINQILNSIIIGIAAGSQPILGYNYGAKKYAKFDDGKVVGQTMFYQAGLKYLVPKGILYPVVGAFRALVEVDPGTGIYRWKKDPFMVWNDLGERIAGIVWDEKEENPEYIGKSKNVWSNLFKEVLLYTLV